jgi:hypothetical protein
VLWTYLTAQCSASLSEYCFFCILLVKLRFDVVLALIFSSRATALLPCVYSSTFFPSCLPCVILTPRTVFDLRRRIPPSSSSRHLRPVCFDPKHFRPLLEPDRHIFVLLPSAARAISLHAPNNVIAREDDTWVTINLESVTMGRHVPSSSHSVVSQLRLFRQRNHQTHLHEDVIPASVNMNNY